ncbi:tyrosinase family oxidase copper chaperone [Streptomyces sp. NPDC007088]|uniref:tyrosinase family oxidase copper chaperone n=1 Tax=Streptomyces sp. NPDC007088 TaxID=3364773 RepID=UPI00367C0701
MSPRTTTPTIPLPYTKNAATLGPSGPGTGRRHLLRALFTLGALGGTAVALAPVVTARPPDTILADPAPAPAFDEVYAGRHIQGAGDTALVDGRPLHLMRRADGGWLTAVDHSTSYATPREAVRAAVDELGGAAPTRNAARHGG